MFKKNNALISVIWTLLRQKQRLRGGMLTLYAVVQTNDDERSGHLNSALVSKNTKKNSTNSFWPIVN